MAVEFSEAWIGSLRDGPTIPRQRTHGSLPPLRGPSEDDRPPLREASQASAGWRAMYVRRLRWTDAAVLVFAVAAAELARFGGVGAELAGASTSFSYTTFGLALATFWWGSLQVNRSWSARHLGQGTEEYRRVASATTLAFGWVAIASVIFKIDFSRGFLAIAFPLGLAGLLAGRKYWRTVLRRKRQAGNHLDNILVVGGARSGARIANWLTRHPTAGFRVTGIWTPGEIHSEQRGLDLAGGPVPVFGSERTLLDVVARTGAKTVMVSDTELLGHDGLNALTWELVDHSIDLMLSPNVSGVVASRIHVRDVAGMPLLHLEEPQYEGASRFAKTAFDRVGAFGLLLVLAPLLLIAALAIKLSDRGPVFFRQERIGLDGKPFFITKFRTMVVNADRMLTDLAEANEADSVLFKIREDPRITSTGKFLRRYSLDELPQLFNVLRGEMSLVGPRPPLASEVELYPPAMHRRLLVRPGMTGLWQVSGRSDLSFEEAVRLDLHYVENFSIVGDLIILVQTVKAVAFAKGAY